jgi:hypothetical protein
MRIAPSSPVQMPLLATLASGVYDLEVVSIIPVSCSRMWQWNM